MYRVTFITISIIALLAWTPQAVSTEPSAEIEYLLHAIGQSNCVFTRNGKDHSPTEAEDHLRMKYSRTKSRIKTAEAFIDRLASESSWTGKPYTMSCTNEQTEHSKQWLYRELKQYRQD
jgi:hypothetical protein